MRFESIFSTLLKNEIRWDDREGEKWWVDGWIGWDVYFLESGLFSNFKTSQYFIFLNMQQQRKRFINLTKLLSVARLFCWLENEREETRTTITLHHVFCRFITISPNPSRSFFLFFFHSSSALLLIYLFE